MSTAFREEMEKLASAVSEGVEKEAVSKAEAELEVIFGNSGKQVVMKECLSTHDVTVSDAIKRPQRFEQALYSILGELGSSLVMNRINKRVWGITQPVSRG